MSWSLASFFFFTELWLYSYFFHTIYDFILCLCPKAPLRKIMHLLDSQSKMNLEKNCHNKSTATDRSYLSFFVLRVWQQEVMLTLVEDDPIKIHIFSLNSYPCCVSRCCETLISFITGKILTQITEGHGNLEEEKCRKQEWRGATEVLEKTR